MCIWCGCRYSVSSGSILLESPWWFKGFQITPKPGVTAVKRRVMHDSNSLRSCCCVHQKKSYWYFIPGLTHRVPEDRVHAQRMSNRPWKYNCSQPLVWLHTGWSLPKRPGVDDPEPESICHPNQILCCHGRRGSTHTHTHRKRGRGCMHACMHTVRKESSNEAVITEKCQIFRPTADSSARLATVRARPTQSKVQQNKRGHCVLALIRGAFQLERALVNSNYANGDME